MVTDSESFSKSTFDYNRHWQNEPHKAPAHEISHPVRTLISLFKNKSEGEESQVLISISISIHQRSPAVLAAHGGRSPQILGQEILVDQRFNKTAVHATVCDESQFFH
jgi:hypothetical protein